MSTTPETLAAGRYRLGQLLGEGGMARVYLAHDVELGVDRAAKLLTHQGREAIRKRLRNEARAMAQLRHPHILGIHDVGKEGSLDYIVMDLALGGSLQDRVAASGPLPMGEAIGVAVKVLSALATAHAAGIVHRDVKPHNVLLDEHGQPMLADFGIAMLATDDRSTKTGVAMGSLAFMPPEQRLDAARVGPTADIYATGCTLFALLTNDNPVDLFLAAPDSPRWHGVPEQLRQVVQTACAPHPSDRYATAKDMADALLEVLDALGPAEREQALNSRGFFPSPSEILADRSSPPAPARTPKAVVHASRARSVPTLQPRMPTQSRDPSSWPLVVGGALLLLMVCGGGGAWFLWDRQAPTGNGPVEAPAAAIPDATPVPEPLAPTPPEPEPTAPPPPEPEPEPAPQPVVPAPKPAPSGPETTADQSVVGGAWTGSANGRPVRMELSGPDDQLQGSFLVSWGGKTDRSPVRGHFEPATQRLILEDVEDALDAGRYELVWSDGRLDGTFVRTAGGRVPLKMYRP